MRFFPHLYSFAVVWTCQRLPASLTLNLSFIVPKVALYCPHLPHRLVHHVPATWVYSPFLQFSVFYLPSGPLHLLLPPLEVLWSTFSVFSGPSSKSQLKGHFSEHFSPNPRWIRSPVQFIHQNPHPSTCFIHLIIQLIPVPWLVYPLCRGRAGACSAHHFIHRTYGGVFNKFCLNNKWRN